MCILLFGDVMSCRYLLSPAINLLCHLRPVAGVCTKVVMGNLTVTRADLSLPCLESKLAHVCSSGAESRLPIALLLVPSVLQPAKGAHHHHIGHQDWSTQSVVLTAQSPGWGACVFYRLSLCIFPFPLSPLPGTQGPTLLLFFPSYPITCTSLLQSVLYRSPSAIFQLVFNEDCSTCKYIFDVFLGVGELHIVLLHHLDLSPPHTTN